MVRALTAVLFTFLIVMMYLPAHGGEPWPEDIKKIKERGELIVAQYGGTQPAFFSFDDAGMFPDRSAYTYEGRRLVGCDIYLANQIAEQLGVRLRLDRSAEDFEAVCHKVASGEADLAISMLSVTLSRAQYLRFSNPYAVVRTGLLYNRLYVSKSGGARNIMKLFNKKGAKIGIFQGCSYVGFAKKIFTNAQLVYYRDFNAMVQRVLKGEVPALYDDEFQIKSALYRTPKLALRLQFAPIPAVKDHIAIAASPKSPNLLAFINILLGQNDVRSEVKRLLDSFALRFKDGKSDVTNRNNVGTRPSKSSDR